MKFISLLEKIKKPVSLSLAITGGILTLAGTGMLIIGCVWSFSIETDKTTIVYGIGGTNYGNILKDDVSLVNDPIKMLYESSKSDSGYLNWKNNFNSNVSKITNKLSESLQTANNKQELVKWYIGAMNQMNDNVNKAFALTITGATIISVFGLVFIFGMIVIIFTNNKKSVANIKKETTTLKVETKIENK